MILILHVICHMSLLISLKIQTVLYQKVPNQTNTIRQWFASAVQSCANHVDKLIPQCPNIFLHLGLFMCLHFKLSILVFYLLICLKVYERWNSWTTSVHFFMALRYFLYVLWRCGCSALSAYNVACPSLQTFQGWLNWTKLHGIRCTHSKYWSFHLQACLNMNHCIICFPLLIHKIWMYILYK